MVDYLSTYIQENFVTLLITLVVIIGVANLVKSLAKWILIGVVLVGSITWGVANTDKINDMKDKVVTGNLDISVEELVTTLLESKEMTYVEDEDGNLEVKSGDITLTGNPSDTEVVVSYKGIMATVEMDKSLNEFLTNLQTDGLR